MSDIPARGVQGAATIGRHPLHPMLIPFPIALLTAALGTDVAGRRGHDPFWPRASRLLLTSGLVSGLAAGAVGSLDYFTMERPRGLTTGRLHAAGNVAALGLTAANLLARRARPSRITAGDVALTAAVAGLLGVTGFLGGELSYRYKVGVAEGADATPS
ncbi:MAG TPA: DUF2231 domain-containing protein [Rubricoccaceae bacterium]|jgi:uncharacterized membrane protein